MKKIDILIPFVEGPDDSLELRFCLRSVEKYLRADPVVWVFGERPGWLQNVNFVGFKREGGVFRKFLDQLSKIHFFIHQEGIGREFLYMYDDQFFLNDITVDELRVPRALRDLGKVREWFVGSDAGVNWIRVMEKTLLRLKKEGKPLFNYETHMPRVFDVERARKLFRDYGCLEDPFQFSTLYFNNFCGSPELLTKYGFFKFGLYEGLSAKAIVRKAGRHKVMNIFPPTYLPPTLEALHMLFPETSKYEKHGQEPGRKNAVAAGDRGKINVHKPRRKNAASKGDRGKPETKRGIPVTKPALREDWPFLKEPGCPEELKVLVADKLTAYHNYVAAHGRLFDCTTNGEQFEVAREVVVNFIENRLIYRELDYYKKHKKVLGLHPKFKHLAKMREYRNMNPLDLYKRKEKLEHNIWRIRNEIEKNDKPHLFAQRNARLKQKQAELAEIGRLLDG